MILSDKKILESIESGEIVIEPFVKECLGTNSYDVHLGKHLAIYKDHILDARKHNEIEHIEIPESGFVLHPNTLYLGVTEEYTETHNLVPMLEGRSSVGRLGMFVHVTAGFGDVGFKGYWTLEISTIQPIRIYPGVEICQIFYHTVAGEIVEYRSNKYQNNAGIQPSLLYKDFE